MNKRPLVIIYLFIIISLTFAKNVFSEEDIIKLKDPDLAIGKSLMQSLKERQSTRSISPKELSLDTISDLLWACNGINRENEGKRTAPSAHNWQEIDIYLALKTGLYLYLPNEHSLKLISKDDIREFTGLQEFAKVAPVDLIYVADHSKMNGPEKDLLFYSASDTGFISQNAYLFCASRGLATVVAGSIDRERLTHLMKLDDNKKIMLIQPVGYPE